MESLTKLSKPSTRRGAALGIAALAALSAVLAPAVPASAAVDPVVAGLTITPTTSAVGDVVTIVASATNATSATVPQISMGIDVAPGLRAATPSGTASCTPRNLGHLVYCGVQNLGPGQTATLTITVTPTASGSYTSRGYARIAYVGTNSYASGTLTVT